MAPHAELAGCVSFLYSFKLLNSLIDVGIAILQNNAEVGDAIEALALSYMPDKNHIYSNSWGPMRPGSGHQNEKPGPLAWKAIETVSFFTVITSMLYTNP